jgi:signal transduction histidine kinase
LADGVRAILTLSLPADGELSEKERGFVELFLEQEARRCLWDVEACRNVQQLTVLTRLMGLVASNLDFAEVKARAVASATELMECEAASLLLLNNEGNELYFDVALGEKGEAVRQIRLSTEEGIAGWVVQKDEALLVNDVAADPRHSPRVDAEVHFRTCEILAVPLRASGKVLGCLQALNTLSKKGFHASDLMVFQALADQVAVAVENATLYAELLCTKRKVERQQEALIQAEKLSAMGQLSAGVAQEIRSPLSAISGYAQLIKRRRPDEKILKPIKVIEDAASHINRIVNGLLDFASKKEPNYQSVLVEEVLERTLSMAQEALVRDKNVVVDRDFQADLPPVTADPRQLQQVFLNLLLNAAEAMPRGGTVRIRTFGEPPAGEENTDRIGRVVILFQDQGQGISEDDRGRVFQPFFTTSREGGTGLGLSICRSIVQQHRGAITFESDEGQGTTFRVHLPVERELQTPARR